MTQDALDLPDRALVGVLDTTSAATLDAAEVAARADVPVALIHALVREGLLVPDAAGRFGEDDATVVTAGASLLDAGLPLAELLDLARRTTDALGELADHAVELFVRYVRDPARASGDPQAAERLTGAVATMLPATEQLLAGHFRQLLLDRARARLDERGG